MSHMASGGVNESISENKGIISFNLLSRSW